MLSEALGSMYLTVDTVVYKTRTSHESWDLVLFQRMGPIIRGTHGLCNRCWFTNQWFADCALENGVSRHGPTDGGTWGVVLVDYPG